MTGETTPGAERPDEPQIEAAPSEVPATEPAASAPSAAPVVSAPEPAPVPEPAPAASAPEPAPAASAPEPAPAASAPEPAPVPEPAPAASAPAASAPEAAPAASAPEAAPAASAPEPAPAEPAAAAETGDTSSDDDSDDGEVAEGDDADELLEGAFPPSVWEDGSDEGTWEQTEEELRGFDTRERASKKSRKASHKTPSHTSGPQRIQKLLARAGYGSRRACEAFLTEGRVSVDGVVVTELGTKADPAVHDIRVDGDRLRSEELVYYLVNKPRGVVCTSNDPQRRMTVIELVPSETKRVFSVGRLDYESRGAVILTNDGRLTNLLTHPRYGVEKTYQVRVRGCPDSESMARLRDGIWLSEGRTLPAKVWMIRKRREESILGMTLCEGKNRQVRRMFAKVGHKVLGLTRTSIGPITLKGVGDSQHRVLKPKEVSSLLKIAQQNSQAPRTASRSKGSRSRSHGRAAPVRRRAEELRRLGRG